VLASTYDSSKAYHDHVARLKADLSGDEALMRAVGGDFIAMGRMEYYLLLSLDLSPGQFVIEVPRKGQAENARSISARPLSASPCRGAASLRPSGIPIGRGKTAPLPDHDSRPSSRRSL